MEQTQAKGKIVAVYPYHDAAGKLLYECCRIEPGRDGRKKDFRYRRPQPDGNGWVWNLEGVEKVIYRLPEILDPSREKHPVIVVEGEKDADTLRALGFVATTSPCGAGHWLEGFGKWLRGRRVVILPDNDVPGWNHAIQVAGSVVCWHAAEIRVVRLPSLADGGDVTEWLADWPEGADAERKAALVREIQAAPVWERKK